MTFVLAAAALIGITIIIVSLVQRSLSERPMARRYRAAFVAIASDLVSKPEFPEAHARQLVTLSSIRTGWLTRFMVLMLIRKVFIGVRPAVKNPATHLMAVSEELRARYVVAMLSAALADSYYSLLTGPIWRAAHSWVIDALAGIKPDVNAHATQVVIKQVWSVPPLAPHLSSALEAPCLA